MEGKEYKYTSNKDPLDGTEEIRLPGRKPVAQGGTVVLTDEEHEVLKQRLNLRAVESDDDKQGESSTEGAKDAPPTK